MARMHRRSAALARIALLASCLVAGAGSAAAAASTPTPTPTPEPAPEAAPSPSSAKPASAKPASRVAFDLVERVAADEARPAGVLAALRGAHKQTRTSVQMPLPGAVTYPIEIPEGARLTLGYTLSAAPFMVETPDLAEPARFRVVFREHAGEEHVLLERSVDARRNETDRRWFDDRIDLTPLGGKRGTLTFAVQNLGDAEKAKASTIYWSTPRILAPPDGDEPSVLFITVDCLRADHLGVYGYPRPTTPRLDALAAEGVRFAHAYSNAPMTLPSIPQIFTSRVFPTRDHETLTHPIARAGIPSAAFVNNAWIPLWLSQGGHADPPGPFDRMVSGELDAKAITNLAIEWLEAHPGERFALYLHYLDAHTPYRPPEEFVRQFVDPAYDGPIGATFNDADGADAGKYDEADRRRIVDLYDASIRYVDGEIGRLLDALAKSGRLDDTLVVVSADHGEEFWEHGRFFHGQSLYDELLHVPLLVRLPGGAKAGTVVERPVRSIDIAPSILEWLALPRPEGFTGEPLSTAIASPEADPPPLFATATQAQFPTRYAIRTARKKLIESLDSGRLELYDVAADPGEKRDLPTGAAGTGDVAVLGRELDDAREILRERGYQVRIVGPAAEEVDVRLDLEGHPKSGTFLTLDRRMEGTPPRLAVAKEGMKLEAQARVGASGSGFRFDRLGDPHNLGAKDLVKLTLEVDGAPVERSAVRLGPEGRAPRTDYVDLRNRSLEAETAPECPAPEAGVRVCLWRFAGEGFAPIPKIDDPAVREKLRSLGYVQ